MSTTEFKVWAERDNFLKYYKIYVLDLKTRVASQVNATNTKKAAIEAAKDEMKKRAKKL